MTASPLTIWIVLGIALIIGEMLTGGFFLLFIALGSFAAALGSSLGLSLFQQVLTCSVVAVLGVLLLRKQIQRRFLKNISLNADLGKEIKIDQSIAPHQTTRITYQGTSWQATNLGAEELKQGDRVVIVGIDGNILLIRKVH